MIVFIFSKSCGSTGRVVTSYRLNDGSRSLSPNWTKNFHFSISSRQILGSIKPPIQWVLGALFPGVQQQGPEAGHSPPTSAMVRKTWISTSTLPYAHDEVLNWISMGTTLPFTFTHI
jgi:hypothetical protein